MLTFGERMKASRRARGMTLEQVARKVGSHKGYVSGIESGKVNPPSEKFIRKFCVLFGEDLTQMLAIAHAQKAPKAVRSRFIAFASVSFVPPSPVAEPAAAAVNA